MSSVCWETNSLSVILNTREHHSHGDARKQSTHTPLNWAARFLSIDFTFEFSTRALLMCIYIFETIERYREHVRTFYLTRRQTNTNENVNKKENLYCFI